MVISEGDGAVALSALKTEPNHQVLFAAKTEI